MDHHHDQKQKKLAKHKNKILNLLPKSASIVAFHQNPPYSPSRDQKRQEMNKQLKSHIGRGFSGPIISIIPEEVRRKSKSGHYQEEPTSPKVSCMGQIKLKKKLKKSKSSLPILTSYDHHQSKPVKPTGSAIRRMFSSTITVSKTADKKLNSNSEDNNKASSMVIPDRVPSLGKLKKFSSGRDHHLSNLDWTAQIASDDQKNSYSDNDEEREEIKIPFSAPLGIGRLGLPTLQPKKEINLWKRRTMAPPRSLQLDSV